MPEELQLGKCSSRMGRVTFATLAMNNGVVPPTLNLDNPPENCEIDLVPKVAKEKKFNAAMSNSFGFGGTNATLIFKKI